MSIASLLGRAVGELVGSYDQARRAIAIEPGAIAQTGGNYYWTQQNIPPSPTIVSDSERYATSDDVYAAVSLLARNAAQVPFDVLINGEPAPDHDLALLLSRCNRLQGGGRKVWMRLYSWLWLTGEVYMYLERSNPLDSGVPNVLYALSGNTVDPVLGDDGYISHYIIHRPNLRSGERVELVDMVPCLDFNPSDQLRGLSPLSSARLSLDTEAAAKSANRDIFNNGLMANAAISPLRDGREGGVTQAQLDQFRDSVNKRHIGEGKRHGFLMVPFPAAIEALSLTPHDAEFIEQDKLTTKDVAKVYQIPPMFLGQFDDATLSNYKVAYRALWELAILPRVAEVADLLNNYLSPQYKDSPVVVPDTSGIEALRDDAKAEADAINVWVRAGFDRGWAARRVTGDDIPDEAISDLIPTTLQPPSGAEEPAGVTLSTPAGGAPRTKAADVLAARDEHMAEPLDHAHEMIDQAFGEQGAMVAAALDTAWVVNRAARAKTRRAKAIAIDGLVATIMPDWDDDPMAIAIQQALGEGVGGGEAEAVELFELSIQPGRVVEESEDWVATTAAADVRHVNETTRLMLRESLAESIALGETVADARARVEATFGRSDQPDELTRYRNRARAIAETELGTAWNHGSNAAIEAAGLNREWLSVLGATTRPDHSDAHGQIRGPGQPFNLAGYPCMYPMDPSLPAEQRIYCHCTVAATEKEPTA